MSLYYYRHRFTQQRAGQRLMLQWGIILLLALGALLLTFQPAHALTPATGGGGNTPALTISAPATLSGPTGTNVIVSGSHWFPGSTLTVAISDASGGCAATTGVDGASGTVDNTGAAQITFAWPALPTGTYHVCGTGEGAPNTITSSNAFTELSQSAPTLTVPTSATSGGAVTITGANWLPSGTQVQILAGPQGGNGCAKSLATLTSQPDGSLSGSFKAPSVTAQTTFLVVAVSPAGTCSGNVTPTLKATASLIITPSSSTNGGTPVTTPKTGTATPNSPPGNPGPCSSNCNTFGGWPWWAICLILLGLLLLLLALLVLLARRRNQEVVVMEEDITSQVDPNSVAPMGNMKFVRTVRVTTQIVDRATGNPRDTKISVFDEFADASGGTRRRPRK